MSSLRGNSQRLWQRLEQTAVFGATAVGGLTRLALSEADRQVRTYLTDVAHKRGYEVKVDAIGNIFITRPGTQPDLAHILIGSHLDTQPRGGKYDGVYGVLAGLEVLESLDDAGVQTQRPITLVNWTNEEGSRFGPSMMGSAVFAGKLPLARALAITDQAGVSVSQALAAIEAGGDYDPSTLQIHRAFEIHIEQGPVLEAEGVDIGVVTGVQGLAWLDVTFTGRSAHAGTTPYDQRSDGLVAAAALIVGVADLPQNLDAQLRATTGKVEVSPNSRNVVPGSASLEIDLRHPDPQVLQAARDAVIAQAELIASQRGVEVRVTQVLDKAPVYFDPANCHLVEVAAKELGLTTRSLTSGAGHDSAFVQEVAPTGMIFIPCVAGISHAEDEAISEQWSADGLAVLMQVVLAASQEVDEGDSPRS